MNIWVKNISGRENGNVKVGICLICSNSEETTMAGIDDGDR